MGGGNNAGANGGTSGAPGTSSSSDAAAAPATEASTPQTPHSTNQGSNTGGASSGAQTTTGSASSSSATIKVDAGNFNIGNPNLLSRAIHFNIQQPASAEIGAAFDVIQIGIKGSHAGEFHSFICNSDLIHAGDLVFTSCGVTSSFSSNIWPFKAGSWEINLGYFDQTNTVIEDQKTLPIRMQKVINEKGANVYRFYNKNNMIFEESVGSSVSIEIKGFKYSRETTGQLSTPYISTSSTNYLITDVDV